MITKQNEDFVHTTWENHVTSPINISKMKIYEEEKTSDFGLRSTSSTYPEDMKKGKSYGPRASCAVHTLK